MKTLMQGPMLISKINMPDGFTANLIEDSENKAWILDIKTKELPRTIELLIEMQVNKRVADLLAKDKPKESPNE